MGLGLWRGLSAENDYSNFICLGFGNLVCFKGSTETGCAEGRNLVWAIAGFH